MSTPQETAHRIDAVRYFELVEEGLIAPDDRVELLEGVIVSMPPQSPLHAAAVMWVEQKLRETLPAGTSIRIQMPFMAGAFSVPEPDVAVVPGCVSDYIDRHPAKALLVVEVAVSTAVQDRLTKAPIYARCGVPDYWIVNLRDERVECFSQPDPIGRRYMRTERLSGKAALALAALPELHIVAADLFPRRVH